ncbi:group XIIA secretory phospholipase A2-like [Watersipora subatra]|uniref:group XIIA secretory phospholipase A2-like n=1 Tax=Watersipora subatra TaxID=2589382 RepID=UPI00355AF3FD
MLRIVIEYLIFSLHLFAPISFIACKQQSFADSLRDISDVVDKVASIANNLDFSGNNNCKYTCLYGQVAVPNKAYAPEVNGCGTFGIEVRLTEYPGITQCCNDHDVCYAICGKDKAQCDVELQRCAQRVCLQATEGGIVANQACKTLSEMLYEATSMLGCQPYKSAQEKACICVSTDYRSEL